MVKPDYRLHTMGSGSFQDLGITIVEDMIDRPIQIFSPTHDKGIDGIFDGTIDNLNTKVRSIIQCKHTSNSVENLILSNISNELLKVKRLIEQIPIGDYILVTNHNVSGKANLEIEEAFHNIGVQKCRIWGNEWINKYIHSNSKLRMKIPRLYGLGDLSNILDERAYKQTKMILESERQELDKFVPTEAFRKSLKSIAENKFVLILGEPMSGKSTIKSCLAISAIDNWECEPIIASKPSEIKDHQNPDEKQIFLVDDAWGITQYRDGSAEEWNDILTLMNSAIKKNTRFILTSRDYIWNSAKGRLKKGKFSLFDDSRVIIEVQNLTEFERAQMLYFHLKLGNQAKSFKTDAKEHLPAIVNSNIFFPESARRLGNNFFTKKLKLNRVELLNFFEKPKEFMCEVIENLSDELRAAIALVYLTSGKLSAPIENSDELSLVLNNFCGSRTKIKNSLEELDGSLLYCENSNSGKHWKFKHPTIGEAFAEIVAKSTELIEIYLRGAKPEAILNDVVCVGINLEGAKVMVPPKLYDILVSRIQNADVKQLLRFICNRADKKCTEMLIESQSNILNQIYCVRHTMSGSLETKLIVKLEKFGLLDTKLRHDFVSALDTAVAWFSDISYISDCEIQGLLTTDEKKKLNETFELEVIDKITEKVEELKESYDDPNVDFEEHFYELKMSVETYITELGKNEEYKAKLYLLDNEIKEAISILEVEYKNYGAHDSEEDWTPEEREEISSPLEEYFKDVDE